MGLSTTTSTLNDLCARRASSKRKTSVIKGTPEDYGDGSLKADVDPADGDDDTDLEEEAPFPNTNEVHPFVEMSHS